MFNKRFKICLMAACMTLAMSTSVFATTLGPAGELLGNTNFDNGIGLPWNKVETAPAQADWDISNNKYNIIVNHNGTDKWDVQFRHRSMIIESGHTYTVKFTIESPVSCKVYAKIGEMGGTYKEYWNNNWNAFEIVGGTPTVVEKTFTMDGATTSTAEFAFHMAGSLFTGTLPHKVSFSKVSLSDPTFPGFIIPDPEPTNAIRVNQIGYAPALEKVATLVSPSTTPVAWTLKNAAGTVVKTGTTTVKGLDPASGDHVHLIDFSSYQVAGKGYKLSVATSAIDIKTLVPSVTGTLTADEIARDLTVTPDHTISMPFDIGKDLYSTMKYDAIKYFYHSRSGVPILEEHVQRPDLARAAGHVSDKVATDKTEAGAWYTPSYTKDISGGWYDAGDHGKYVVNGGISTWTMYNQYERMLYNGNTTKAFADNTMNIPESGNAIPDILDEARVNTEVLLKMQVTPSESAEYAGMAHHKAHDIVWTALAVRPDQDKLERVLKAPSTAATLNLAAVAAQASRLWKTYDATFASTCLTAASNAWDAAVKHPKIYAPIPQGVGGGAYGDDNVEDEFYWAACELYITTGEAKYLTFMKASPRYLVQPTTLTGGEDVGVSAAFDWGNLGGLGTISLALVPNGLTPTDLAKAKANIVAAADVFIATENREGYGSPVVADPVRGYEWGSNSIVINQAIVMGYAYEFTKNVKYLNGAATAMDYLLGRNPNVQSYVTGYGDNPLENPHHRFWAYQVDNSFPAPPQGVLSGGPNSGLQDPWVKGSGWKAEGVYRAPQKCFMDHIESWSTNEVTINWNAPLSWMTAFMDEKINSVVVDPNVIYGDVNGDKLVNTTDYSLVKSYIMGKITVFPGGAAGLKQADVNGDGVINVSDYILINKFIAKKITKFPVG